MTLVDAGPAEPCAISTSCGQMEGYVHDLHSPHHPLSYVTPVVGFNALDQQAPSTSFTVRLPATGAYVWSVGGEPSMDEFGRDVPEPYRFSITVDPGDSQVLPTPPTVVRAPRDRVSLPAWEHAIVRARCVVGRVVYVHSRLRRGRVISVLPRAGAPLARGTRFTIVVSSGPRAHRHHRHRARHRHHRTRSRR